MKSEAWKHNEGVSLTQADAVKYLHQNTRLLWTAEVCGQPAEGHIIEIASNGQFVCMAMKGSMGMMRGYWFALEDIQILSLLDDPIGRLENLRAKARDAARRPSEPL